jgi:non-ribosomal peptide synthetase component F
MPSSGIQLARSIRWMLPLAFRGPTSRFTAADLIERRASARADVVFVRFEGREVSYRAYNRAANRIAHWALGSGLGRGDVVSCRTVRSTWRPGRGSRRPG